MMHIIQLARDLSLAQVSYNGIVIVLEFMFGTYHRYKEVTVYISNFIQL
jgi:hypothetical protein